MMKRKRTLSTSPAQAIVEFALILTVLLMMIFIVIESARILWAWNQVQNAAREGARYAITGRAEPEPCPVAGSAKFDQDPNDPNSRTVCDDLRVASIIARAHNSLSGIPLNEQSTAFEDENYYNIEIWGVNEDSILQYDHGGMPNQPVVVRVTYQVPIITPFFRVIRETVPVFGQVTLTNESFGQLGGSAGEGQGLPPDVPPVPTPGVTPSPMPPTPSPTPSPTPTDGPTSTPTPTNTPDICPVQFEGSAVAGNDFVFVTGEPGSVVTIIDLTTGDTLGSITLVERDGHACAGFGDFADPNQLNQLLQAGHVLLAQSSDGSTDTTIVLPAPPTATFTPTNTPFPTSTATNTPVPTATFTPAGAYITLSRKCVNGPNITFDVIGVNWPNDEDVSLFWDTNQFQMTIPAGHGGFFDRVWSFTDVVSGTYTVRAISASFQKDVTIKVPCNELTPTPVTATPTNTPAPADLVIGPPKIVSNQPVRAYTPVDFSVVITNAGDIDVSKQFFVDLFINPSEVYSDSIPLNYSDGYSAVSSLSAGASRTLTITIPSAFQNTPDENAVYGMVDSVLQVDEPVEINNVSDALFVNDVVDVNVTPTPTGTPIGGDQRISGVVQVLISDLSPQSRAAVTVYNGSTPIRFKFTDGNGFYEFTDIPPGTYTVKACVPINGESYSGLRTGITPPNDFVNIYMLPGPCS